MRRMPHVRPRLFALALSLVSLIVATTAAFAVLSLVLKKVESGEAPEDFYGHGGSSIGDVNADGVPDYAIGAPYADPGGNIDAGSVYVYSGVTRTLLYRKDGVAAGDLLGLSIARVGNVNGDGRDDFIVGAQQADPGGRVNAGSAYVFSGLDGAVLWQLDGASAGDAFGYFVDGAGDMDADGRDDFLVGAPLSDVSGIGTDAGRAYGYSGSSGATLFQSTGVVAGAWFGGSVAGIGDLNGNGMSEFVIGSPFADPGGRIDAGTAYVYRDLGNFLIQIDGASSDEFMGSWLKGAGDWNGDAVPDLIVGAYHADPGGRPNAGSVFIYSGANWSVLYQKDGVAAGDELGYPAANAGDVDDDGHADLLVGAPCADPGGFSCAGSAYLYSGSTSALLFQVDGRRTEDRVGRIVDVLGDLDGDGEPEILICGPEIDVGEVGDNAGCAFIYGEGEGGNPPHVPAAPPLALMIAGAGLLAAGSWFMMQRRTMRDAR